MAVDSMVGQDLINEANARLAGYQNGVDPEALLSYLNEGKDELWALLKNLNDEYFVTSSQNTDNEQLNYFATLDPTKRQFTLPSDLREIKFIEVATAGSTQIEFEYRDITDNEFRMLRRDASTQPGNNEICKMLYTIVGKDQMVLAQFPPAALNVTLWYVRSLPDFESDQVVDEILFPYVKKIASYACQRAMLGLQDASQFSMWVTSWKQDCITVTNSAAERNQSDASFVEDFCG